MIITSNNDNNTNDNNNNNNNDNNNDIPPEKKTLGSISLKSTRSWCGEEFLLLRCRAKAPRKGVLFV